MHKQALGVCAILLASIVPIVRAQTRRTQQPAPLVVIFADVTSTITPTEHESVAQLLRCLIHRAPPRARVFAFPLSANVQQAELLTPVWTVPSRNQVGAAQKGQQGAQTAADGAVKKLRHLYADVSNRAGAIEARTCIFDALRRAEGLAQANPTTPIEVYIISDLVEDCESSYNDKIVQLNKKNIERDIAAVEQVKSPLLRLNGASVTLLLPRSDETQKTKERRPSVSQRRRFWEVILRNCKAVIQFNPTIEDHCSPPANGRR